MLLLAVLLSGCGKARPDLGDLQKRMDRMGYLYGRGQVCDISMEDNTLTRVKAYLHDNTESQAQADELYADFQKAAKKGEGKLDYTSTQCDESTAADLDKQIKSAWSELDAEAK